MIEIKNINKTYKPKSKNKVNAIKGIDLEFSRHGLVFLLGKSGSGKSTFLNILGGLDSANTSRIYINDEKLDRFDETTCSNYRNTYVGFVFQEYNLLSELNVYKNVELALQMQGQTDNHEKILNVLKRVDLEGLEDRELDELSGGQKQRVAIARALVKEPTIILADEPTGNLDSETSEQVFELFKELSKDKCVIVVTHDAEYAHKYGDRIIEISDGEIVSDSAPKADEDHLSIPKMIKPKLPWDFIYKMSIGNVLNNKLRMVVTAVITAFLVAILSAVYTMLYVNEHVNSDLLSLANQENLIISKNVNKNLFFNFSFNNENLNDENLQIDPVKIETARTLALENGGLVYDKTYILVNDQAITMIDLNLEPSKFETELVKDPDEKLVSTIQNTTLTFTAVAQDSVLLEDLVGFVPQNKDEVVISSYLADWLIQSGQATSYQDLIDSSYTLKLDTINPLRVVGVEVYQTPILNNETTALYTVGNSLYVHSSFFDQTYNFSTSQYGLNISHVSDLPSLITSIKNLGTITISPNYVEKLNSYTRYDLTLVISVIVPVLGYLAIVFLGNYISSSILFRKKQIGILRAIGNYISNVEHIFRLEAIFVGFIVMVLVYFLIPTFVDIVNFAFMVHFSDSFISFYHYPIYHVGLSSIIEIFLFLSLLITILTFTLTHNINLIDPVDVISGR